jgi:predicted phage tail protein
MAAHMPVRGAKKGGGRTPGEEKDSLRSVQYAEVLDLICEGEVEGLVSYLKSVYLDKVPIENADGSMNFEGVQFAWTHGTQGQAALPGFKAVQSEIQVGVPVLQPTPIVRSITNAVVNQVRVTIGVPQLSETRGNGDIGGNSFEFAIDIQSNGGGYVERYRRTISGKTMSKYQLAIVLDLTGAAPWDIRVRRISPVSPGVNVINAFTWDSYTEIQTLALRYPNRVVHGLRVSAQQFARIPERAYDMMLARIQVPVNYDPITRVYSGAWNGTFKIAWTNNPAWIFYDLVTHPRYGLGEFIDAALVDKWALYTIGQYCDALVPNGRGGTEPRFTCNVVFQEREEAYKVLQDLAAVFRGVAFYGASAVQFAQDAPQTPRMIFTPANVSPEGFSYASTSATQRHSQVLVYWNNPADFFARVPELVTDDDLVAKLGIITLELNAIGITSRGQAARLGRWALYSEDRETDTIAFNTGEEGAGIGVGQVFEVQDPSEAGERLGGRISVATASAVTLDAPVTLNIGETYTLTIMLADAAAPLGYTTEVRSVTTGAGIHSTLTVAPAFSQAPPVEAMWMLQSNLVKSTLWRCLGVKEESAGYQVTGVSHDPSKYDFIENGLKLEARPVSRLSEAAVKPTNLQFAEVLYIDRSTYKSRLTVSWLPGPYATGQRYRLNWRYNLGAWNNLPEITDQTVDISGLEPGTIEVRLRSVNALGNESLPLDGSYALVGKLAPPQNMSGLVIGIAANGILATWNDPSALDPDWQASELSTSSIFAPAGQITYKRSTTHLLGWLPAGVNTIYGRHWDEERPSAAGASAQITIVPPAQVTLTRADVEANFLTAQWNDCKTSQPILRYEYRVGTTAQTYEQAAPYGSAGADSRSDVIRGKSAGLFRVWFVAFDLAGNPSTPTFVDVTFSLPTDFSLAQRFDGTFAGSGTNVTVNDGRVWFHLLNETDATHFSSRGWANDNDAIAAGAPVYFQPGATPANYYEEYDLLTVVSAITIRVTQVVNWLVGTGAVETDIAYKTLAGDPWTTVANVSSLIANNLRYIRITVRTIGAGTDDLAQLASLFTECSLKRLYEPFNLTLNAADTLGTPYVTTVGFNDIGGATANPLYPNPNGIVRLEPNIDDSGAIKRVLWFGFNAANARVSGAISGQITGV